VPAAFAGLLLLLLPLLGACAAAPKESQPGRLSTDASSDLSSDLSSAATGGCPTAPGTVSRSPATIADAVALANGLLGDNASLSIDCFLSALSRPMTMLGAVSIFSLQPSVQGALNPRIFIFSGNLVMSVVPAGMGSPDIELAEYTSPVRSIKGQMAFPLTAPLTAADPYDSIRLGAGTVCGSCHPAEQQAPQVTVTAAFESEVLQPTSTAVVPLQKMQDDNATCDPQQDPQRCAILNALFNHGAVVSGAFSPEAPTFN
jgi:hypothetical protein